MPPKKTVNFSNFDREVLARLPISSEQREELIKSLWEHEDKTRQSDTVSVDSIDSEIRVEVVSKPSVGSAPVVDV